jgi:hypothetical protein
VSGKREKRPAGILSAIRKRGGDLHALDHDGMVVCNPRDREAAHRAQVERIATDDWDAVTCKKCLVRMRTRQSADADLIGE